MPRKIAEATAALLAGCLFALAGCGAMANGRGWGQDATPAPGWDRIGRAAKNAALAPGTWAPAAGALAFRIGRADENVQEWATKNTPVFGSQRNAELMSDNLLYASGVIWAASGLATPGGNDAGQWLLNKAGGFGVQTGAGILLGSTVEVMKHATDRTRPNGRDKASFPSGHASGTSFFNTMASKNAENLGWSDSAIAMTRYSLGTLTAATAWARLEANEHYPSDVLAGIAVGHFFGAFFTDAFLGIDDPDRVLVLFEPSKRGGVMTVRFGL